MTSSGDLTDFKISYSKSTKTKNLTSPSFLVAIPHPPPMGKPSPPFNHTLNLIEHHRQRSISPKRFKPMLLFALFYIRTCHTLFRHFHKDIPGISDFMIMKVQEEFII